MLMETHCLRRMKDSALLWSFLTVMAFDLFGTMKWCRPVRALDPTTSGFNTQHVYVRYDNDMMTYQAALAACRYKGYHLAVPTLTETDIKQRFRDILSHFQDNWYWAPMYRVDSGTWRWLNGSGVNTSDEDKTQLKNNTFADFTCAVWQLNNSYLPQSCSKPHYFMCLETATQECRLRSYKAAAAGYALVWDNANYTVMNSLTQVIHHFKDKAGKAEAVLYNTTDLTSASSKSDKLNRQCKNYCDDFHFNQSQPFGCWFVQFYDDQRCQMLLARSMPAVTFTVEPRENTFHWFRTCFRQYAANVTCKLQCGCRNAQAPSNMEEALAMDKQYKAELIIPTSNLSATQRRKTSASDTRPSAQGVGCLGLVFAGSLIAVIVITDVKLLWRDLLTLCSNIKAFFRTNTKN